jgi:hypothetical protein
MGLNNIVLSPNDDYNKHLSEEKYPWKSLPPFAAGSVS